MNDAVPFVSIIIPTRPGQTEIPAVAAARALDYPRQRLEILVARGRQPAVQRNAAIGAARGELIYFLDDDSRPAPDTLRQAVAHFQDPEVKMVGGPNLCPAGAPFPEQVFAVVLGSWLAFGPSRARYDAVGVLRSSSEKELILCNLMARRDTLQQAGGFDEALYPNEENALMDAVQKRGGKLLYDPAFIVHRHPRPTLAAFCRMLYTYGRGRAEQFRLHPTPGSALNLVPPLFCLYLALLALSGRTLGDCNPILQLAATLPLALYALAVLGQTLASTFKKDFARAMPAMPLLVISHLCYGCGFWRGLFTTLRPSSAKPPPEVVVETLAC